MCKKAFCPMLIIFFAFFGCGQKPEERVRTVMIDGIKHIQNPAKPLKGMVTLELEKQLEINPYEYEEIGMRALFSVKDNDGEVILYDRNEAHRFTKEGTYLGSIFSWGQGPDEINPRDLMKVDYINNQIWAKAPRKILKLDKQAEFLEEISVSDFVAIFIDPSGYITRNYIQKGDVRFKQILLKSITETNEILPGPVFIESLNNGLISGPVKGGFSDPWGAPDIAYSVDKETKKVYVAEKAEYKIQVKDLKGNTHYIIEKPHANVKISRTDKENILEPILQNANFNWAVASYPDELLSFKEIKILPHGYIAVYRISGPKEFMVDVFDDEGKYIYVIDPSSNALLEGATFYSFGFTKNDVRDDFPVYVEYQIKNLPEIFRNN